MNPRTPKKCVVFFGLLAFSSIAPHLTYILLIVSNGGRSRRSLKSSIWKGKRPRQNRPSIAPDFQGRSRGDHLSIVTGPGWPLRLILQTPGRVYPDFFHTWKRILKNEFYYIFFENFFLNFFKKISRFFPEFFFEKFSAKIFRDFFPNFFSKNFPRIFFEFFPKKDLSRGDRGRWSPFGKNERGNGGGDRPH